MQKLHRFHWRHRIDFKILNLLQEWMIGNAKKRQLVLARSLGDTRCFDSRSVECVTVIRFQLS